MATHKDAFNIPEGHVLKQTDYKAEGPVMNDEDWKHEEFDAEGQLVARYTSWHHTDVRHKGGTTSGWQKFDTSGKLVSESAKLFE